jgi:hypothetical protein
MNKIVYQFDDNGYFLYETIADESPLEPGIFLYPRNTTIYKPPKIEKKNKVARWTGTEWIIEEIAELNPVEKLADFFKRNPDVWQTVNERINNKYT